MNIFTLPLGASGSLVLSESAGAVSLVLTDAIVSGNVKLNASVAGSAPALLAMLEAGISNPVLKAIVAELATIAAALPA